MDPLYVHLVVHSSGQNLWFKVKVFKLTWHWPNSDLTILTLNWPTPDLDLDLSLTIWSTSSMFKGWIILKSHRFIDIKWEGTSYNTYCTTFNNPAYRSETALADYIWDLQCPDKCYERGEDECENSIDYEITWKILARAPGYNPITGMCRLCLKESFLILFHPETASLNKKTEIYQSCKHKKFKLLADCNVTWSPWKTTWPN